MESPNAFAIPAMSMMMKLDALTLMSAAEERMTVMKMQIVSTNREVLDAFAGRDSSEMAENAWVKLHKVDFRLELT